MLEDVMSSIESTPSAGKGRKGDADYTKHYVDFRQPKPGKASADNVDTWSPVRDAFGDVAEIRNGLIKLASKSCAIKNGNRVLLSLTHKEYEELVAKLKK